jgi:Ribbon-helix-helix protein, copG family
MTQPVRVGSMETPCHWRAIKGDACSQRRASTCVFSPGCGPACRTDRDTLCGMSSAISVRLDSEAMQALAQLEATGISRSEAIRRAILDSAGRLRKRAALAAEAAALEADEDDRREMLEVAGFMESMRAPG